MEWSQALQPTQLVIDVAGGVEAAIYMMRRHVEILLACHAVVKLDFMHAFNSIGRDLLLEMVEKNTPEVYHFTFQPTHVNQH